MLALVVVTLAQAPNGEFVNEGHLHELDCIVEPAQICEVEQDSIGTRLVFMKGWALMRSPRGFGGFGNYVIQVTKKVSSSTWSGRLAWCDWDTCVGGELPKDLNAAAQALKFDDQPVTLQFEDRSLLVTLLEPVFAVADEDEPPIKREVVTWRYATRAAFDALVKRLRARFRPALCANGPAQELLPPSAHRTGPCLK